MRVRANEYQVKVLVLRDMGFGHESFRPIRRARKMSNEGVFSGSRIGRFVVLGLLVVMVVWDIHRRLGAGLPIL